MRGGDFFIHVETIRENTPKGWIMNPNYSEILRFHDFGDMLLKINTVLSYLENSRAGTAELPEFHSLHDSGFGKKAACFYLLQIFCTQHNSWQGQLRGADGRRRYFRSALEALCMMEEGIRETAKSSEKTN